VFIRTDNLLLRPGWVDDAPALTEAFAREDVVMTLATAPWPYRLDDAVDYLSRERSAHEADLLIFLRTPGAPRLIGGVGIAMILLILSAERMRKAGLLPEPTQSGIIFWSSVYIPVVVAMAASQNVRAGVSGGPAAITAGVAATAVCFALVPAVDRIGRKKDHDSPTR
jgi:malonate transporter MadL subunit